MTPALYVASEKAAQVVTRNETILQAGRAVLFVLSESGWGRPLPRLMFLPPFVWAIEAGYAIVAANRPFFAKLIPRDKKDSPGD